MAIESAEIHNILVIKFRGIGDVVLSTIVLKNLRAAFPSAGIDFLTDTSCNDVVEGNPDVRSVICFDRRHPRSVNLMMDVRRRKYDLVIDLFGNPRSALVTLFSGARYRLGYRFRWREYCYTMVVDSPSSEIHNTEFYLDALRAISIPIIDRSLTFPLSHEAETFAETFFENAGLNGKYVVALNPCVSWSTRRWPAPRFAQLGDRIARQYHAAVIIIWGPGQEDIAREIQSAMEMPARMIPPTTLKQLGAILKRSDIMVTNNSGPMHLAAAIGTPVLEIYGSTNPEIQGAYAERHGVAHHPDLLCLGCNFMECPIGTPCMEDLSVDTVLEAFQHMIDRFELLKVHEEKNG